MAALIRKALQREGYSVSLSHDGQQALAMGMTGGFDVLLLDVMLPHLDGFDIVKGLRAAKQMTPVIMVSARDTMADIVRGLDAGADDYLTKPFPLDILLARVRALARRGPITCPDDLEFEGLRLDRRSHELTRGDRHETLTRTEFALLETLMRRPGGIVPHSVLAEAGWGIEADDVTDNTIYVFMRALRAKISRPGEPQLLHTVRGVGYTLKSQLV